MPLKWDMPVSVPHVSGCITDLIDLPGRLLRPPNPTQAGLAFLTGSPPVYPNFSPKHRLIRKSSKFEFAFKLTKELPPASSKHQSKIQPFDI
jgi:hypothetical protein